MARLPELLVGAGTVLSVEQADRAIDAGAQFIVMPGFGDTVVARCLARGVPVFPGVVTPTELMRAIDAGITDVKFFPAGTSGGLAHLSALGGPFPAVRFIPTGGIGLADLWWIPGAAERPRGGRQLDGPPRPSGRGRLGDCHQAGS